jgi:ornithine carbamoyltransferase
MRDNANTTTTSDGTARLPQPAGDRRSLISIDDLSDRDICQIVEQGVGFARRPEEIRPTLQGRVLGAYFRKTSTRTRTAFSAGAVRLGAAVIAYGPDDLQVNTGESVADTGRVFAGMLDGVVARTAADPAELRSWAATGLAVINAMSSDEHPTQGLADLTTLQRRFGAIEGLRVVYVGEGNNTAAALALALSRFCGTELVLCTPSGYGVPADKLALATSHGDDRGAMVSQRHDLDDLPGDVDVVYTTRWQTTGTTKPDPTWREAFRPFQVDTRLMDRWPDALFMHDLPAHRGEEVTAAVLDGPRSIAFEQAQNKLWSAMAVLQWCLGGHSEPAGEVLASAGTAA